MEEQSLEENYCVRPKVIEMVKYKLWEFHEALFTITGYWPKCIVKSSCEAKAKAKNIPRDFIYEVASPPDYCSFEWRFDPISLGADFCRARDELDIAVKMGDLPLKIENLGVGEVYLDSNSYLFRPAHILWWALCVGIHFSEELQSLTGVYLKKIDLNKKTLRNLQIKIRWQLLRLNYPGEKDPFYFNHPFIKALSTTLSNSAVNTILDNPLRRGKGRPSHNNVSKEWYYLIQEVCSVDATSRRYYHIRSLRILIETTVQFIMQSTDKDYSKDNLAVFLEDVNNNIIIKMYTENANQKILKLVERAACHALMLSLTLNCGYSTVLMKLSDLKASYKNECIL